MDTQNVEWRPIPGLNYQASSMGDVKRIIASRNYPIIKILKPHLGSRGYYLSTLCVNGQPKTFPTHNLISLAFLGPKPLGFTVHHVDGNKQNNRIANLVYVSSGDNTREAHARGLGQIGVKHNKAKLSEAQVLEIRSKYARGLGNVLARQFGITGTNVLSIVHRETWRHLQ